VCIDSTIKNTLVSPAYGTVLDILEDTNKYTICIFLSPFDVHYQYFPIDCTVSKVVYDDKGLYNLAYDLNKSIHNEKAIHYLSTLYGEVIVYQIAGKIARRINYFHDRGYTATKGEKLGIIHFGSRVDISFDKRNFHLMINKGDKLRGPHSIIGYWDIKSLNLN
jgi:phosphatidylserine decarboxylase